MITLVEERAGVGQDWKGDGSKVERGHSVYIMLLQFLALGLRNIDRVNLRNIKMTLRLDQKRFIMTHIKMKFI